MIRKEKENEALIKKQMDDMEKFLDIFLEISVRTETQAIALANSLELTTWTEEPILCTEDLYDYFMDIFDLYPIYELNYIKQSNIFQKICYVLYELASANCKSKYFDKNPLVIYSANTVI